MRRFFRIVAFFAMTIFLVASLGVFAESNIASNVGTGDEATVDDGNYLLVNYDENNALLTSNEGKEPENSIKTDANNNYMEIKPGWLNWGYMFKSPLPASGDDVVVSFDFAGKDLSPSYYTIAISERATEKGTDVYNQFGL